MKELKLSITHYKVIHTIKWLNDQKLFANQDGLYKILHGDVDSETKSLMDAPAFGSLISYNSKKVCRYVLALTRYGFVTKIFDRNTKELYLTLTEKGRVAYMDYFSTHKEIFKKKNRLVKPTIVKIGE